MKLLLAENRAEYFATHRRPLAEAARRAGYDVHVTSITPGSGEAVRAAGFAFYAIVDRADGNRASQELAALLGLRRLARDLKPAICHFITIRAVFHGLLALLLAGSRPPLVVCSITGLGFLFTDEGLKARIGRAIAGNVIGLLGRIIRPVFVFQNADDRALFAGHGWVPLSQSCLVRGSGVDIRTFARTEIPAGPPVVLFCARYLVHKGIYEFVEAARRLRAEGADARFVLVGDVDARNPACVSRAEVDVWVGEGVVEDWGHCNDMPERFSAASIVVLPSWREGLPKAVIEAASVGRPTVTTDVPGCRDAIQPGITGLLVPPRDPAALAGAISSLLGDPARMRAMGSAARLDVERRFSAAAVAEAILEVYRRRAPLPDAPVGPAAENSPQPV